MRVLVAAVRTDAGETSEGVCTARVVRLLAERGHDVSLLVAAPDGPGTAVALARAAVGAEVPVAEVPTRASRAAALGWHLAARPGRYRGDVGVQLVTGFGLEDLAAVRAWRRALAACERERRPDVTLARGAGLDVHPLLARATRPGAWVANVHDPWPTSWYPPAYASRARGIAPRQEARSRRVLRAAPALTAPTGRLFAHLEDRSGIDLATRGHVVPHLAPADRPVGSSGPQLLPDRPFVLCHAGTLLGPREPGPLLAAVDRLAATRPEVAADLGLALVGPLDRRHRADGAALAGRAGSGPVPVVVHDRRVPARVARTATAAAAVAVVIEADGPTSPFLPAKVADLVGDDRPVLALSPARSATADLLGADHPLRVDPGDVDAIARAVERAWSAWRAGALDRLGPPASARQAVGPAAVGAALDAALDAAVVSARPGGPAGAPAPGPARHGCSATDRGPAARSA